MADAVSSDRVLNHRLKFALAFLFAMVVCAPVHAEPTGPSGNPIDQRATDDAGKIDDLNELRVHAETIDEILSVASQRVDALAAAGEAPSALIEAIRQELSLSRRWNRHLSTILLDVVEARRALGEREREAAREITRMTAVAEEARLELLALKEALDLGSVDPSPAMEERSEVGAGGPDPVDTALTDRRRHDVGAETSGLSGFDADLQEAHDRLNAMQAAQQAASHDVDAVRAKIIEALATLSLAERDFSRRSTAGTGDLTSEDITGWAASMAARLGQDRSAESDEDGAARH